MRLTNGLFWLINFIVADEHFSSSSQIGN